MSFRLSVFLCLSVSVFVCVYLFLCLCLSLSLSLSVLGLGMILVILTNDVEGDVISSTVELMSFRTKKHFEQVTLHQENERFVNLTQE
jgi:hypothetical protein